MSIFEGLGKGKRAYKEVWADGKAITSEQWGLIEGFANLLHPDQDAKPPYMLSDLVSDGYANFFKDESYDKKGVRIEIAKKGINFHNRILQLDAKMMKHHYADLNRDANLYLTVLNPAQLEPLYMVADEGRDSWTLECIKGFQKEGKVHLRSILFCKDIVASVIDGVITLNDKGIAKYERERAGRQKKLSKLTTKISWRIQQITWTEGKMSNVVYENIEDEGEYSTRHIYINEEEIIGSPAHVKHALEHDRKQLIADLRSVTPPDLIPLFTEALVGGFIGIREIVELEK